VVELEPVVGLEPLVETAPVVDLQPVQPPEPVAAAEPALSHERSVTAALRELAEPTRPVPSPGPASTADATTQAAAATETADAHSSHAAGTQPEPAAPIGLPALDVLPGRHRAKARRGLFRRGRDTVVPSETTVPARLPRRTATVLPPRVRTDAPQPDPATPPAAPATSSGAGLGGFTPSPFGSPEPAPATPAAKKPEAGAPASLFGRPIPPSPFGRGRATGDAPAKGAQASEPIPLTRRQPAAVGADVAGAARGGDDFMATRSALASQALSELSRLNSSSYTPAAVVGERPAPLTRRVPRSSPAAEVPEEPTPASGRRRTRSADDVRNRLSGFRAGVERGRGETVTAGAPAASAGGGATSGGASPGAGPTSTKQTHRSTTKEEKR
jgi:hypothetical protein